MALLHSIGLPLGWSFPDFSLKGTDGILHASTKFLDKRGLLIIFTCNHCPYAQASWPLLIELQQRFGKDIRYVAINPNDPSQYPEDSFDNMKIFAKKNSLEISYLFDETQKVAKAFQAQCTPDPYLFKISEKKPKLFYHGRINDNWQDIKNVKEKNLEDAIIHLINNQYPPKKQPSSMGCSIKWKNSSNS